MVHHKQCAMKNSLIETYQKRLFKIHSPEQYRQKTEMRERMGDTGCVCYLPHGRHTDIQLTSCSAFIPIYVIGTGCFSSTSTSETSSTLIFMSRFASQEDVGYVSLQGPGTCFCKSKQFYKTTIPLSAMAVLSHYMK
jgi:hypothetical protein